MAYTNPDANDDRKETILQAYLNGLSDSHLADKVYKKDPKTYSRAMQYVEDKEAHEFRSALFIHRRHQPQVEERHEEPMDISALGAAAKPAPRSNFPQAPAPNAPGPSQSGDARQDRFERQLTGLQNKFTKFMSLYMEDRAAGQPQQLSMPQSQQQAHHSGQQQPQSTGQRSNRHRRNRPHQNAQPPLPRPNSINSWTRALLYATTATKWGTRSFSAARSSGRWPNRATRPNIPPTSRETEWRRPSQGPGSSNVRGA